MSKFIGTIRLDRSGLVVYGDELIVAGPSVNLVERVGSIELDANSHWVVKLYRNEFADLELGEVIEVDGVKAQVVLEPLTLNVTPDPTVVLSRRDAVLFEQRLVHFLLCKGKNNGNE